MKILAPAFLLLLMTSIVHAQHLPYVNHTEAGILAGTATNPSFTAQTFNGVKITKWKLEAGITAGVDIYPEVTILPISAGIKWNPFNALPVSPYLSFNAGYGFGWLQPQRDNLKYDGGYILHPSMGLRIKTKNTTQVYLGMGFRQQRAVIHGQTPILYYDYFNGGSEVKTKEEYRFRRLSLSVGMSF